MPQNVSPATLLPQSFSLFSTTTQGEKGHMELSANWKKLKATLSAEAPKKTLTNRPGYGRKILKRNRPQVSVSKLGKKLMIEKPSIGLENTAERVNEGLSQRYILFCPNPAHF